MKLTLSPDKLERISAFRDTLQRCQTIPALTEAIRISKERQRFIGENDMISNEHPRAVQNVRVTVSPKRSFEAASAYKGKKVCVLNFASATNPGGAVMRGSNAQEECLCRCSTLYECLTAAPVCEQFHNKHRKMLSDGSMNALYNDDCIYTPDIVVFKSDTSLPQPLPEADWMKLDVITCAAPRLGKTCNRDGSWTIQPFDARELKALHVRRFKRIMEIASAYSIEVLILGAFGCGAFHNPPDVVAAAAKEAISTALYCPTTVEFAVYCSQRDMKNYEAFDRTFRNRV